MRVCLEWFDTSKSFSFGVKNNAKYRRVKRVVLIESQKLCWFGCGKEENVSHVFYECKLAEEVWQQILNWLNGYLVCMHFKFICIILQKTLWKSEDRKTRSHLVCMHLNIVERSR